MHDGVSLKKSGFCEACVLEHNVGSLIGEDKAHSKHNYNPTPSLWNFPEARKDGDEKVETFI